MPFTVFAYLANALAWVALPFAVFAYLASVLARVAALHLRHLSVFEFHGPRCHRVVNCT